VALGVVVTAVAGALSLLFSCTTSRTFAGGNEALYVSKELPIGTSSPSLPACSICAGLLSLLDAGCLRDRRLGRRPARRVVPAIVATLVTYTGLAFATGGFLRQHYLAPLVTSKLNISQFRVGHHPAVVYQGRPAGEPSVLNQLLQAAPGQLLGKRGVPKSVTVWQYLAQHGYTQLTTYQPAGRFWPFQWIEGGWQLALSVLAHRRDRLDGSPACGLKAMNRAGVGQDLDRGRAGRASHGAGSHSSSGLAQSCSSWGRPCTGCSGTLTPSRCRARPPLPD